MSAGIWLFMVYLALISMVSLWKSTISKGLHRFYIHCWGIQVTYANKVSIVLDTIIYLRQYSSSWYIELRINLDQPETFEKVGLRKKKKKLCLAVQVENNYYLEMTFGKHSYDQKESWEEFKSSEIFVLIQALLQLVGPHRTYAIKGFLCW
jgi:hypothetical protein